MNEEWGNIHRGDGWYLTLIKNPRIPEAINLATPRKSRSQHIGRLWRILVADTVADGQNVGSIDFLPPPQRGFGIHRGRSPVEDRTPVGQHGDVLSIVRAESPTLQDGACAEGLHQTPPRWLQRRVRASEPGEAAGGGEERAPADDTPLLLPEDREPTAEPVREQPADEAAVRGEAEGGEGPADPPASAPAGRPVPGAVPQRGPTAAVGAHGPPSAPNLLQEGPLGLRVRDLRDG